MRKTLSALLTAALLCIGIILPVQARELPDPERSGSITFEMRFDGQELDSGALTIRRVGYPAVIDADDRFVLLEEFGMENPVVEDVADPALAKTLAELADEKQIYSITADIHDGKVVFAPLEYGLYLVTQAPENACKGFAPIQPFLISMPQWMDETYVYELTASPKVPLVSEPVTKPPATPSKPGDSTLPQTGQLNWPVPMMILLGLSLFITGWLMRFKMKREG